MKVIFIKDLKKQGKKDEIKEFKDGFAKYLINEGYAVLYTPRSNEILTGKEDKVFGAISSKQICDELKRNGFDIDKKKIVIDGDINTLGYHDVCINLHKKVKANIRIELVK